MSKNFTSIVCLALLATGLCVIHAQENIPDEEPAPHRFVIRADLKKHEFGSMISRFMLTAKQTEGRYSIVDEIFKSGMRSFPHKHAKHSETFIVLTGKMEWTVGGETQAIGPGDLVYIPPEVSHVMRVIGDQDVHAIMIYEPGGYELNYQRRTEALSAGRRDPAMMQRVMQQNDVIRTSE